MTNINKYIDKNKKRLKWHSISVDKFREQIYFYRFERKIDPNLQQFNGTELQSQVHPQQY